MNTKALAVAASLWVPMVASAATEASVTDRQEALSAKLEQILAKNGISIGGAFRGEVGSSEMSGDGTSPYRRNDESIGYTSVDFDLRARPNTLTTARAVFRMHLDHANFFGSPYAPLETRWLSMDGAFADMAYYHLGNLQAKWSPLVIGATEPGFLYTPRIFAQEQKQAMDERFIGGGVRNLQGANLGLRAAVPAYQIDSFDVSLLAAKQLSASPIGSIGSINVSKKQLTGDGVTGFPDSMANFDRWALGAKANVTFLKGITLGGAFLHTQDLKSTFGTIDTAKKVQRRHFTRQDSVVAGVVLKSSAKDTFAIGSTPELARDTIWQNGLVLNGAFGTNVANLIGNQNLIASLDVDVARSSWDRYASPGLVGGTNPVADSLAVTAGGMANTKYYGVKDTGYFTPVYKEINGLAVNIGVTGGWKAEGWTVKAKVGYLMNDSAFRSDLAQAAVFDRRFGRIFNTEQDASGRSHYNTFDALYHNVHRFVAEDRNEYAKSPYDKVAYSNYVGGGETPALGAWTASTRAAYLLKVKADDSLVKSDSAARIAQKVVVATATNTLYATALTGIVWDRDIQLVLPGGEASANRVGPKFGLDFDLMQGGVEVKVDGYMLTEAKGSVRDSIKQLAAEKAKFQQVQVGTRIRADKFISGWTMPIELTGSLGLSTAKGGGALDYTSTAINAGLYVGVIKRLSVLGGYQTITGKDKVFFVDRNQSNMAGGLEFKVQEGAYLLGMYNLIKTEYPNATQYNFDQSIWSTKISVSF